MDILGNIMKNMTNPPKLLGDKERALLRKRQEDLKKQKEEDDRRIEAFRQRVTGQIRNFTEDEKQERLTFEPMNKHQRTIVYDILEKLGDDLNSQSFGKEEVDRHVVLFKPEHVPCGAELVALKRGQFYDPNAVIEPEEEDTEIVPRKTARNKAAAAGNEPPEYLQKYKKHLGGLLVAKDAAKVTETNLKYGNVSSELKKDKRTIEETLADIRARKQQKLS